MIILLNFVFLFLYIISYSIGITSYIFSLLYYNLERVVWLKYYLIFLAIFSMLFFIKTLELYAYITLPSFVYSSIFESLVLFSIILTISFMIYIIPAFLYHFLKINWSIKTNIIFIVISIFFFLIGISGILITPKFFIISVALFYTTITFLFILGFRYYKNITEKSTKFIFKNIKFYISNNAKFSTYSIF